MNTFLGLVCFAMAAFIVIFCRPKAVVWRKEDLFTSAKNAARKLGIDEATYLNRAYELIERLHSQAMMSDLTEPHCDPDYNNRCVELGWISQKHRRVLSFKVLPGGSIWMHWRGVNDGGDEYDPTTARIRTVLEWMAERRPELLDWRRVGSDYELVMDDGSVYRGNCTVWHRYPSGTRAGSADEEWLCDVWQRIRWEEQDAQTHH